MSSFTDPVERADRTCWRCGQVLQPIRNRIPHHCKEEVDIVQDECFPAFLRHLVENGADELELIYVIEKPHRWESKFIHFKRDLLEGGGNEL